MNKRFFSDLGKFLTKFHVLYRVMLKNYEVSLGFDFRDIWIGLYWDRVLFYSSNPCRWSIYLVIFTFGIRIRKYEPYPPQ